MPRLDAQACSAFEADARRMFFSKGSIAAFLQSATPSQLAAAQGLLTCELGLREESRRARLMRRAAFPTVKSLGSFDFSDVAFPEGFGEADLRSLDFVRRSEGLVFYGRTGRGKTHLATALGVECVARGLEVRFLPTAALVRRLAAASREGTVERLLADLARADLLILDEFGYIPLDVDGGRLLFQVISDCYERRSLVLTTNIEFGRWGTVFGDDKLAAAAVDRIVHHGRLLEFGGPSRRMGASLMLGGEARP